MPCRIEGNKIICSRHAETKCKFCGKVSTKLCDYPLSKDKTCDAALCKGCAISHGLNIDTCPNHPQMRYF